MWDVSMKNKLLMGQPREWNLSKERGIREIKRKKNHLATSCWKRRKCLYVRLIVFVAAVFLIELYVGILFSRSHQFGKLFRNIIDRKLSITNPHHWNVSFRIFVRANLFYVAYAKQNKYLDAKIFKIKRKWRTTYCKRHVLNQCLNCQGLNWQQHFRRSKHP